MAPGPIELRQPGRALHPAFRLLGLKERSPTGVSTLSSLHRFDFSPILLCLLGHKPKPRRAGSAPDVLRVPTVHL